MPLLVSMDQLHDHRLNRLPSFLERIWLQYQQLLFPIFK